MRRPLRKKVLYVDDDVAFARLVAGFLADEFEVIAEATGEAALERVAPPRGSATATQGQTFDVILADLDLPGIKGQELFVRLRARSSDLARRMAFTSSADAMPGGGEVPSSVAVRYLKKPFDRESLLTLVRRVLRVVEGRPTWPA